MDVCYARRAPLSVTIHNSTCICYDIPRPAPTYTRFVDRSSPRRRRPALPTRPRARARTLLSWWPTQSRRTYCTWTPRRVPSLAHALRTWVRLSRSRRTRVSRMSARPRTRHQPLFKHYTQPFSLYSSRLAQIRTRNQSLWRRAFRSLMYACDCTMSTECTFDIQWLLFSVHCSKSWQFSCFPLLALD